MVNIPDEMPSMDLTIERRDQPAYCNYISDIEDGVDSTPWFQDILNFKLTGEYPPNTQPRAKRVLRLLSAQYVVIAGQL